MSTKTLDLGCGSSPRNPFHADDMYGVDVRDDLGEHVRAADLAIEAIPYADNSFDYLTAFDFIEHIPRVVYAPKRRNSFVEFMNEAWRVVKPGGYFLSQTPAFPHSAAFWDPTHVNFITAETFPMYFDDRSRWASIYGFKGAFHVVSQEWRGPHLVALLRKVMLPPEQDMVRGGKISVVIPVQDGARSIAPTLDAVLTQTYTDFELICIDNGSTDSSLDILQEYAARDSRIHVLRMPSREDNMSEVLNYGLPHVTGEYVVHVKQDDLFSLDWLEKMQARAAATGADAVLPDRVFPAPTAALHERRIVGLDGNRDVELSGRDALLRSLDWSMLGAGLWSARLIRFFGFADFGASADAYLARVLFLHANKVVFSEGTIFHCHGDAATVREITTASFDHPYAQLRLYQMLHTERFPHEVLQQQAVMAVLMRNQLQQWLDEQGMASLGSNALQRARERLASVTASMKKDPMFVNVA